MLILCFSQEAVLTISYENEEFKALQSSPSDIEEIEGERSLGQEGSTPAESDEKLPSSRNYDSQVSRWIQSELLSEGLNLDARNSDFIKVSNE